MQINHYIYTVVLLHIAETKWYPVLFSDGKYGRREGKKWSPDLPSERFSLTYPPTTPEEDEAWRNRKITYWKDAVIPYKIQCSIENLPEAVASVHRAMKEWEEKTCLRFVRWTNETHYLRFIRHTNCWGEVGASTFAKISVGAGCDYDNVMAHEIGHAVGMFHEHNRKDRDKWVKVIWKNIRQKDPFKKRHIDYRLNVEYDYESIMHYPWNAFSKNNNDTMVPLRSRNGKVPAKKVSKGDIKMTSLTYGCPAVAKKRKEEVLRYHKSFNNTFNKWDCVDKEFACEKWAKLGYCSTSSTVRNACKRSCRSETCYGGPCKDIHSECPTWKAIGHCKFVEIVQVRCQKSCNPFCQECADKLATCKKLAEEGRCVTEESVRMSCKTSCWSPTCYVQRPVVSKVPALKGDGDKRFDMWPNRNNIGAGIWCIDWNPRCPYWARKGECVTKARYMLRNCLKSCPQARCDDKMIFPPGKCSAPLGLSVDKYGRTRIPDSAFTTDSFLKIGKWTAGPENARLYFEDDPTAHRIGAWCSQVPEPKYLQVDLQGTKTIRYIATQGRDKHFEYVWSFQIQYSETGASFITYQENKKDRLFYGNCDHVTPTLNRFKNKFRARFIRFIPKGTLWPCVRLEFYGC